MTGTASRSPRAGRLRSLVVGALLLGALQWAAVEWVDRALRTHDHRIDQEGALAFTTTALAARIGDDLSPEPVRKNQIRQMLLRVSDRGSDYAAYLRPEDVEGADLAAICNHLRESELSPFKPSWCEEHPEIRTLLQGALEAAPVPADETCRLAWEAKEGSDYLFLARPVFRDGRLDGVVLGMSGPIWHLGMCMTPLARTAAMLAPLAAGALALLGFGVRRRRRRPRLLICLSLLAAQLAAVGTWGIEKAGFPWHESASVAQLESAGIWIELSGVSEPRAYFDHLCLAEWQGTFGAEIRKPSGPAKQSWTVTDHDGRTAVQRGGLTVWREHRGPELPLWLQLFVKAVAVVGTTLVIFPSLGPLWRVLARRRAFDDPRLGP